MKRDTGGNPRKKTHGREIRKPILGKRQGEHFLEVWKNPRHKTVIRNIGIMRVEAIVGLNKYVYNMLRYVQLCKT